MYMKRSDGNKLVIILALAFMGCAGQSNQADDAPVEARTPVTVTTIRYDTLEQYLQLNATSSYLQRSFVKSNMIGYVMKTEVKIGDFVHAGQPLFVMQTKESRAIGNAVNKLNPDFKFTGVTTLAANASGYITELDHQPGDYVQDGDQLAVISDAGSFEFVMSVPYEDRQYVKEGVAVTVVLPGNERLPGTVRSALPVVDSVSQTQQFAVTVHADHQIPPDLVATVDIRKVMKPSTPTLPRQSILTDETQSSFWIMKMINDSTAVKVPVQKGLEMGDRVEILSPSFTSRDRILLTGNYGLADTSLVTVQQ